MGGSMAFIDTTAAMSFGATSSERIAWATWDERLAVGYAQDEKNLGKSLGKRAGVGDGLADQVAPGIG